MSYPPFAVTVDLVLMTIGDGTLSVLLQRRAEEPFADRLALPGGFVSLDETLDRAARRVLADKAGLAAQDSAWLEQLYTFGDPQRDLRMRTVSVAYFALLPHAVLEGAVASRSDLALLPVTDPRESLAFDHSAIIAAAHERLRGKLAYAPVAFALLPDLFTLRDLQTVHEAITGTTFNKPAFRRRMLDTGWIEATGQRESDTPFRPAELYRLRS
ncbi:NUDIX domain-containing protein [Novosphingobium sp. ERN07]|uniref:8-oxo-dGTP diphosphatase n=1 Tax=Novosphingobium taihuense TaxID=260085 RepID=A0A7W7EXY3_9SPHN|nr:MULTISPECIES: NUDIX domain-containing protein [Novosphingobium]MBB4615800.1 8-oxo-dGTP diphosphatase [Novosphingobium taihuense]NLR73013.1 NUDIX domain-containing protein [Novosphingobium sp. ERN07]TWH79210.1 8-oxo-dGTP diphosphatase [Novosphingobium taihuense]